MYGYSPIWNCELRNVVVVIHHDAVSGEAEAEVCKYPKNADGKRHQVRHISRTSQSPYSRRLTQAVSSSKRAEATTNLTPQYTGWTIAIVESTPHAVSSFSILKI